MSEDDDTEGRDDADSGAGILLRFDHSSVGMVVDRVDTTFVDSFEWIVAGLSSSVIVLLD